MAGVDKIEGRNRAETMPRNRHAYNLRSLSKSSNKPDLQHQRGTTRSGARYNAICTENVARSKRPTRRAESASSQPRGLVLAADGGRCGFPFDELPLCALEAMHLGKGSMAALRLVSRSMNKSVSLLVKHVHFSSRQNIQKLPQASTAFPWLSSLRIALPHQRLVVDLTSPLQEDSSGTAFGSIADTLSSGVHNLGHLAIDQDFAPASIAAFGCLNRLNSLDLTK